MANDQHSGRYPWGVKVDKTEVTEEGLRVEGHKEYDVKSVLKLLEECIDGSCEDGCSYFYHMPCVGSLLDDVKGCIEQLMENIEEDEREIKQLTLKNEELKKKLDGATHYNNLLLNSRKTHLNYIAKLKDDKGYLKYEVDALTSQNQALREKLDASETKYSATDRTRVEAEIRVKKLRDALDASEKENEELKKMLQKAVAENDHFKYEVNDLAGQNQALQEKLRVESKENTGLIATLKNYMKTNEELEKKLKNAPVRNCTNCDPTTMMAAQNQELRKKLKEFEKENEELKKKSKAASDTINDVLKNAPARNCINCDHYDVCMTVAERKARKANNYKSCSLWKKADEK